MGFHAMNVFTTKTVVAVACLAASALAGHAESPAIRNCTWCHGGSAQGYTPAPQLAGQRASYIEQQLVSFADHTRDSPFSKQYMWGAAANVSPQLVHYLATYFTTVPPKAADDGFEIRKLGDERGGALLEHFVEILRGGLARALQVFNGDL